VGSKGGQHVLESELQTQKEISKSTAERRSGRSKQQRPKMGSLVESAVPTTSRKEGEGVDTALEKKRKNAFLLVKGGKERNRCVVRGHLDDPRGAGQLC